MSGRLRILAPIAVVLAAISNMTGRALSQPVETMPLQLEAKIRLGEVRGRIDHMSIDPGRQRLFVAELGNDSVSVVDLKDHKVLRRISGLKEPQGVAYVASTDTLYVANAGDGSLRMFRGESYAEEASISLGDDADNIRVDDAAQRVFVGYGSGALAIIDAATHTKIGGIRLEGHPESFQLTRNGKGIFVNVPNAREIAVIDRGAAKQVGSWPMRSATGNFPMALDEDAGRVFTVFRNPAKLGVLALPDGKLVAALDTCRGADDVFFDAKRQRLYVSCDDGSLDVVDAQDGYRRIARIPTVSGARTALLAADLDRLFLAVRAERGEAASIRIFRPLP